MEPKWQHFWALGNLDLCSWSVVQVTSSPKGFRDFVLQNSVTKSSLNTLPIPPYHLFKERKKIQFGKKNAPHSEEGIISYYLSPILLTQVLKDKGLGDLSFMCLLLLNYIRTKASHFGINWKRLTLAKASGQAVLMFSTFFIFFILFDFTEEKSNPYHKRPQYEEHSSSRIMCI